MSKKNPRVIASTQVHSPIIKNDIKINNYTLEDEACVLSQKELCRRLNITKNDHPSSLQNEAEGGGAEMSRFATHKWLNPFISNKLTVVLKKTLLISLIR